MIVNATEKHQSVAHERFLPANTLDHTCERLLIKRSYRDIQLDGRPEAWLVLLMVDREVLARTSLVALALRTLHREAGTTSQLSIVPALPRDASGKVRREQLRRWLRARVV